MPPDSIEIAVPRDLAVCAIRISLGRTTTADEIDAALIALVDATRTARAMIPASAGRA